MFIMETLPRDLLLGRYPPCPYQHNTDTETPLKIDSAPLPIVIRDILHRRTLTRILAEHWLRRYLKGSHQALQEFRPQQGNALCMIKPAIFKIFTDLGFLCRSYQYSTGYPLDIREIEPQSATGYGATPEYPNGKAYVQAPKPYPEGTRIHRDYWDYKAQDKDYARKKKV